MSVAEKKASVKGVHDAVMPKMERISALQNELSELKKKKREKGTLDSSSEQRIDSALSKLENGHQVMMEWMRAYDPPADSVPKDEAMAYLRDQHKAIKSVRKTMLTGIEEAEQVLKAEKE